VTTRYCWGIFRERAHSPGRESDDAEILRLTAKHLEACGYQVELKSPEDVTGPVEVRPAFVFLMCERAAVLAELRAWTAGGVMQVNDPAAVLATYREQMVARFQQAAVPFIPTRVVATSVPGASEPDLPLWVKRSDVHNTQDGDVVFADTRRALAEALGALHGRGIARAVLQPHVPGDLIKFYGVGPGDPVAGPGWFRWFYHKDQALAGHPFDAAELARIARAAAAALGLEVYGGDAIATGDRGLVLLDLNAWPSFALYRDEASAAIASYLDGRFGGDPR
jgi:hypothetical protein